MNNEQVQRCRNVFLAATTSALLFTLVAGAVPAAEPLDPRLQAYVDVLEREGREPLAFVLDRLDHHDLLVFDDAWHPCAEPFDFYVELVRSPAFRARARWIFVEALSIDRQPQIDAYLRSDPEDATLLYPAFQDDFSGSGWPLQSYFDLLHAVWEVNRGVAEDERLRVVAVNAPTYWPQIETAEDLTLFRRSLMGNDYTMYRVIAEEMRDFDGARKGIFLTNTRHAYKAIEDRDGRLYWNVGTFLHERHPGKTYSIRFHNLMLSIQAKRTLDAATPQTTEGTESLVFSWIRMANGLWDSAFEAVGHEPLAVPLAGNVFGSHPYVGNHMLGAAPGQTMADANDAIIFLAPLEQLHRTALVDSIYTPEFKLELARRYRILYTEAQLASKMEAAGVGSVEALIDSEFVAVPLELIPETQELAPRDAWRQ